MITVMQLKEEHMSYIFFSYTTNYKIKVRVHQR